MKNLIWLGTSRHDVTSFSGPAMRDVGYNLDLVQRGLEPLDWKPMPAVAPGVRELRVHSENEYRVIYLAQRPEGIYVLHAFVKKTETTSPKDIDLAKKRFKQITFSLVGV